MHAAAASRLTRCRCWRRGHAVGVPGWPRAWPSRSAGRRWLFKRVHAPMRAISLGVFVAFIVGALALNWASSCSGAAVALVLLHNALALAGSYGVRARAAGLPERDRRAVAFRPASRTPAWAWCWYSTSSTAWAAWPSSPPGGASGNIVAGLTLSSFWMRRDPLAAPAARRDERRARARHRRQRLPRPSGGGGAGRPGRRSRNGGVARPAHPPGAQRAGRAAGLRRHPRCRVAALLREHRIDTVVHLAAIVTPGRHSEPRARIRPVDVVGHAQRASRPAWMRASSGLVVSSSGAAYGYHADNPAWLSEDAPLRGNEEFAYSGTSAWSRDAGRGAAHAPGAGAGGAADRHHPRRDGGQPDHRAVRQGAAAGGGGLGQPFVFVWDQDVVGVIVQAVRGAPAGVFNVAGDGALRSTRSPRATCAAACCTGAALGRWKYWGGAVRPNAVRPVSGQPLPSALPAIPAGAGQPRLRKCSAAGRVSDEGGLRPSTTSWWPRRASTAGATMPSVGTADAR